MKIVFDSEEEKNRVIEKRCPTTYKGECDYICPFMVRSRFGATDDCKKCWEQSGIELEIKEKTDEDCV